MAKNVITKSLKAIYKFKVTLMFFVIWAHVSLLNLFFVNYSGPVFLWQENSELITIEVHFIIALATTGFYLLVTKLRNGDKTQKRKLS